MLSVAVIAFTFAGYAQVEHEETSMFSTTRSLNPALQHNFGQVSGTVQSKSFNIKNTGKTPMTIVDVKLPERVGVTIQKKVVQPGEDAVIIATVDPTIANQGAFTEKIIVITEQNEPGIITRKEITLTVSGDVK